MTRETVTATTVSRDAFRFTAQSESLFACLGLVMVGVLYRSELAAMDPAKWATVSAWIVLVIGISIASQLDRRFKQMLRRLNDREAIALTPIQFEKLLERVFSRARTATQIGGLVVPAILIISYGCVYAGDRWNSMLFVDRILLVAEVALEMISAFIVGRYVGQGISYGFLGRQLAKDDVKLNVILGHSDNAAGLRPIGDFYFYQATVTALPVVFFTFWVLIMPVWSNFWPNTESEFASQWKNTYLIFFFIALGIEVLSFLVPLWFFHQQMVGQKSKMQRRADNLSASLLRLQRNDTSENQIAVQEEGMKQAMLVEQIAMLESLPTWALAPEVRQRFAWSNLAFLSPAAIQMSRTVFDAVAS